MRELVLEPGVGRGEGGGGGKDRAGWDRRRPRGAWEERG